MKPLKRLFIFLITLIMVISAINITALAKTVPVVTQIATVNVSSLRLRSGPTTNHATIDFAPMGDYAMVIGKTGNWYHVSYNLQQGFMHEKYLNTYRAKNVELGYGTVTANKVNLRSGPGTSFQSVGHANFGEQAYVIGFNQQWYKVICKEKVCYIRSDYLELTQIPYENAASLNEPIFFKNGKSTGVAPSHAALKNNGGSTIRSKIVSEAKKYLGVPYVWGGSNPQGFDCSGYVQYVMMKCDVSVPRTTEQQARLGTYVTKKELKPGDLVFLQNTYREGISHVGIYIGNDQMIHASSSKGVTVSNISSSYYLQHYHSARKLFN